jgi:hypothetical protein
MNDNLGVLLAAGIVGLLAYRAMSSPQCDAACQQFFGAALSESGKIATAYLLALTSVQAMQPQPRRNYRRS